MEANPSPHPADRELSDFALGKLDDDASERVGMHLEGCATCRDRVAAKSADSFLGRVRDARRDADANANATAMAVGTMSIQGPAATIPRPAEAPPLVLAGHPDYEDIRELGRGGMGVVYLARNRIMGREEVLKVVGRAVVERPGVADRFLCEIRAVAQLRHPNIVTAYSATRLGEDLVFAMEYVEGCDLAKLVRSQGPLPISHACYFAYQAALGLQHAHEEGLIHRDIKPANLMLSRKGTKATVTVLDFGLAKLTREGKVDGGLTSEGQSLGTPDFIAPEQVTDAQAVDIRADIYSLGGPLYFLLTGRPPFEAKTLYDIYQAHTSRDADPLNNVRPEVPSELAALVEKMMAKDPARRFQTPGEAAVALVPFFKTAGAGGAARPPSQKTDEAEVGGMGPGLSLAPMPLPAGVTPSAGPIATESGIAEIPALPAKAEAPARARHRMGGRAVAVAAALVVLGSLAVVFRIRRDDGATLVLEVNEPGAIVAVDRKPVAVSWDASRKRAEIRVLPGDHLVEGTKDGFTATGDKVSVSDGGRRILAVSLEPAAPPAQAQAKTASGPPAGRPEPAAPETRPEPAAKVVAAAQPKIDAPVVAEPTAAAKADAKAEPAPVPPAIAAKPPTQPIGIRLVLVPAGVFLMGSTQEEFPRRDASAEVPKHPVRITQPFLMGATEVTQWQYRAVMDANPSCFRGRDDYPVETVSWYEAIKFCNELSVREGLPPFYAIRDKAVSVLDWSASGYRLPTDAEWEYACRAGTGTIYPCGEEAMLIVHGWVAANSSGRTHAVGSLAPNAERAPETAPRFDQGETPG